uniref:protein rolling stone-like n=1 Tax=Myxine glutinosa TaxID=7769 RepID=UPI00358F54AA
MPESRGRSFWRRRVFPEFSRSKLSFRVDRYDVLIQPQWFIHPAVWLAIRLVVAMFVLTWCIVSGVGKNDLRWFIYLSNLAFLLLCMYLVLAAVNLLWYWVWRIRESSRIGVTFIVMETGEDTSPTRLWQVSLGFQWLLRSLSGDLGIMVAFTYWAFEYSPETSTIDGPTVVIHGVNVVVILAECLLSHTMGRLLHIVYVWAFIGLYLLFSVIFWLRGGINLKGHPYIYRALDYSGDPLRATVNVLLLVLVLCPLVHGGLWLLDLVVFLLFRRSPPATEMTQYMISRQVSQQSGDEVRNCVQQDKLP